MARFARGISLAGAIVLIASGLQKMFNSGFRSDMNQVYELGDSSFGTWFFLVVGVIEFVIGVLIVWPRTRIPAALAMVLFFVGALIFNIGFAVDPVPENLNDPSTLIPADVILGLLGLGIAALWRRHGEATDLLSDAATGVA